jgi:hypothetical protein
VSPIAIILENLVMYFRSYICTYLDKDFAKIGLGKFLSESFKVFFDVSTIVRRLAGVADPSFEWKQVKIENYSSVGSLPSSPSRGESFGRRFDSLAKFQISTFKFINHTNNSY